MRTTLIAAATTAALALGSVAAEAAPIVVVAPSAAPAVTLVAGGCGFGAHRGLYGRCVGNGFRVRRVLPLYRGVCVRRWTAFGWRRVCR